MYTKKMRNGGHRKDQTRNENVVPGEVLKTVDFPGEEHREIRQKSFVNGSGKAAYARN